MLIFVFFPYDEESFGGYPPSLVLVYGNLSGW